MSTKKILQQIHRGQIDELKLLQQQDSTFHWNSPPLKSATGDTLLHIAAGLGHSAAVHYLLDNFTPKCVDSRNNDGKTALQAACQFAQAETARILIKHGADVNAIKRADWTPLMLACTRSDSLETLHVLFKWNALPNLKNKDGWTALHLCARSGNSAMFKALVDFGADYRAKTANGRGCLHISALHANFDVVKYLVNELKCDINSADRCENRPLHEAVLSADLRVVEFFLPKAEVSAANGVGFNAVHLAASCGQDAVLEVLIERKVFDLDEQSANGWTALHCAARKGWKGTCEFLVSVGCKEDVLDRSGRKARDYFDWG